MATWDAAPVGWLAALAPVLLLILLVGHRDRREAGLRNLVAARLPEGVLWSDVVVHARADLLGRHAVVRLDLTQWRRGPIWDAIVAVRRALPPWVDLVIEGCFDGEHAPRQWLDPVALVGDGVTAGQDAA